MSQDPKLSVVNTALLQFGKTPISDLNQAALQRSTAAQDIVNQLDDARDAILERHGWLCALSYARLDETPIADDENWRYRARYLLPAGALRIWEVAVPDFMRPFFSEIDFLTFGLVGDLRHEGEGWEWSTVDIGGASRILIRADIRRHLHVSYVRRANWAAFRRQILDAIALEAARRVAYTVSGDRGREDDLKKKVDDAVQLAISTDGTQQGGQPPIAPSIPARLRMISR